jgi:hypothetical protein
MFKIIELYIQKQTHTMLKTLLLSNFGFLIIDDELN